MFKYFDAYQVGLTATPVKFVARNTYELFDCPALDPTAKYEYKEAVDQEYLVPFKVKTHTTKFLREGIKYNQLDPHERQLLEEQVENADDFDYSKMQVDKNVYNKDTDRAILRNLMENGIQNGDGSHIGKSIVFARNHEHAMLMNEVFEEMYPQYGEKFCMVIDSKMERPEQLIDDFKGPSWENKDE